MYTFRFWFEHGGGCLWSADDTTRNRYGYKVARTELPLSEALQAELTALEAVYRTALDWNDPAAGCQWSDEQREAFRKRTRSAYKALCDELGDAYRVLDESTL